MQESHLHAATLHDQELARLIPDLPRIVAFRNRLIHGYAVTDHDVVWNTVTTDMSADAIFPKVSVK